MAISSSPMTAADIVERSKRSTLFDEIAAHFEDHLFWRGRVRTDPPLCITPGQLAEGFEVLDAALEIADRAMGVERG